MLHKHQRFFGTFKIYIENCPLILFDLPSTSSKKYRQHLEKYRPCHIKYRRENHFWKMASHGHTIEENKMPSLDQQKCRHSKKKYRLQKCRHSKNKMPSRPVIPEEKNTVNEVKYRHAVPSMKNVRNYAVNWQYFFFAVKKLTAFFWGGYAESMQKIPSRTKMPSRPATLEEKEYRQWRKIPSSHTFDEKIPSTGFFWLYKNTVTVDRDAGFVWGPFGIRNRRSRKKTAARGGLRGGRYNLPLPTADIVCFGFQVYSRTIVYFLLIV